MNILLYSPDNAVTRNFMPHHWMFLLKSLTPPQHEVFYKRLPETGRLTRPKRWLDFRPFTISFIPDKISIIEAEKEVREACIHAYSLRSTIRALRMISDRQLSERAVVFFARLAFRGIYFPQLHPRQWVSLLWHNRHVPEAFRHSKSASPPSSIDSRREVA